MFVLPVVCFVAASAIVDLSLEHPCTVSQIPMQGKQVQAMIAQCTMKTDGHCLTHGQTCSLTNADVELAGSPCQDHSLMGPRNGMDGVRNVAFFSWAKLQATKATRAVVLVLICGL